MRRINHMRRRSRKEKDEENGVDRNDESGEEEQEGDEDDSRKSTDKRRSVTFSGKKSKESDEDEDESSDSEEESEQKTRKRKSVSIRKDDDDNEENSSDEEPDKKKKRSIDKRKSTSKKKSLKKNKHDDKDKEEEEKEEEEEEEEETQYEVEDILDEKFIKGVRYYLIRWKGYEPESDTWEPESTLSCPELIKKYKASRNENNNSDARKAKNRSPKKSRGDEPKKPKRKHTEKKIDWDSDDEFEVDRIIEVHFKKNGNREFLVLWKGYPASEASWEPEENLDCKDLINKFMNKVEAAKSVEQKELRVHRVPTERFTLYMPAKDRRLSRRLVGKQRVHYYDAE